MTLSGTPAGGQTRPYDLAIVNGSVVDGSGQRARRADVAIAAGRIAVVGAVRPSQAREVIDARGLVVSPGFIDVHTHADDILEHPHAENFVRMGVTTVVAGNCGTSALDVGGALLAVDRAGLSVNFATLVGHNTVRRAVMGVENRLPTITEMARMRSLVWRAMADGALGFSTGLQYVPGAFAKAPEIIDLAGIAGNAGGVYATHLRNEGTALESALGEALNAGRMARARVQVSHLKVDSPRRWGASTKALAMIDAARARGIQVMADQYVYTAASSSLGIRFPSWALEGGHEAIAARLSDEVVWAKVRAEMRALLAERGFSDLSFATVASYSADPSLNGLTMKDVAKKLKGADSADAQLEAARDLMLGGDAVMVYSLMSDHDVERIMRHPFVAFASDGGVAVPGPSVPHPRSYGNAARVLGEYVRGRSVLPLEDAVRKMTSLPAGHFRLGDRGRLMPGHAADIVMFDPTRVRDAATFERPHAYAEGIPHVLVNGVAVVRHGRHTGARPGGALAGSGIRTQAAGPSAQSLIALRRARGGAMPHQSSSAR